MTVHAGDSTKLLASIVGSSDDAIISKTLDGVITTWNKAAERIYGYQAAEIIGHSISLLMPSDRANEMVETLDRIRTGERVGPYQTTRRRKDGTTIAISLTVSPVHDAAGRIVGASTIARDITERERVQEQLRSASQYARSLIEASLDSLVTISPAGKITDVNEATIRVTGVARGQLAGTDFSDYFTEPDRAREAYRQVFAQGFVTDYPLTIRHTGGGLTDVLYNASVYRDADGNAAGVFAAARDVTDSRRLLREHSETKAFLDNILQSSTKYSIIGQDLDHRILSWNKGALRNYGYTAEEVIGQDSSILHTPQDVASGAVERLLAAAYQDDLAEGTFERVRKDGSRLTASVVVTRRDDAHFRASQEGCLPTPRQRGRDPPRRRPGTPGRLPVDERRHLGEEAGRGAAPFGVAVRPQPDRGQPGPAGDDQPGGQDHRRERGDDPGDRGGPGATGRHRLLRLLHRAGPGPRGLPPGFRAGLRHRLPADHPAHRRRPDRRALQRLGVQRRGRRGARRVRRRPRRHRPEAG